VFKGFKDFLLRGNVVELAVAVVIGAAFTSVVTAFTTGLIKPLINAIGGAKAADGLGFHIIGTTSATFMDIGGVINAIINFLIVAAVVYFAFVLPVKHLQERRKRGQEPGPSQPTDIELLAEIRDLLRAQSTKE
jgi:large conductance mechanosensitive channel